MNKKITELTELAAAPSSDDLLYIVDTSEPSATASKKISVANASRVITESSGPTMLTVGAIADGEPSARVGATLVGMVGALWDEALTKLTFRRANAGTANTPPTSGIALENTNAATVSQNQFSPTLLFKGQGWKTNATAGSQETLFRTWLQQRTGTVHSIPQLIFSPSINGTAVGGIAFSASLSGGANNQGTYITGLDGTQNYGCDTSTGFAGFGPVNASMSFGAWNNASLTTLFAAGGAGMCNGAFFGWAAGSANAASSLDVQLHRVAADTLALRRLTNPQNLRITNSHTDTSNGEWLNIGWSSNFCIIQPQANGTGTVRPLGIRLVPTTTANLPAAAGNAGLCAFVTDATTAAFRDVLVGEGSISTPVHCDGTDWRIG
jgi:hypothetical protein